MRRDKIIMCRTFVVEGEDDVDVLVVDQDEVQRQQLAGLASLKTSRDSAAVEAALDALTLAARNLRHLLAAGVAAARVRCTLGETAASEAVFHTLSNQLSTVASQAYFHGHGRVRSLRQRPSAS